MSKKQGKSKKNVFGLVSKIGSLIKKGGNNPDNNETPGRSGLNDKDTTKRNFNIHLSEDNLEVFQIGDEEEEEEEDEDEKEKEKEKENKEDKKEEKKEEEKKEEKNENDKNISENTKNEEITNKNQNNINNINNDEIINENEDNITNIKIQDNKILNNNIDNTNINNINEENKENINNNINNIKEESDNNKENKDNKDNKDNEDIKNENKNKENLMNNYFETCHICLKKGNDFNSNEMQCFSIVRNKKKKSMFQKIGFFKKPKYDLVNYKLFFDECFIYLSKDIILDKKDNSKRRINNVLKIKNIINYTSTKEQNNKYHIIIEIINKNGNLKNKELYIEEQYFKSFNEEINKSLKLYGGLYKKNK